MDLPDLFDASVDLTQDLLMLLGPKYILVLSMVNKRLNEFFHDKRQLLIKLMFPQCVTHDHTVSEIISKIGSMIDSLPKMDKNDKNDFGVSSYDKTHDQVMFERSIIESYYKYYSDEQMPSNIARLGSEDFCRILQDKGYRGRIHDFIYLQIMKKINNIYHRIRLPPMLRDPFFYDYHSRPDNNAIINIILPNLLVTPGYTDILCACIESQSYWLIDLLVEHYSDKFLFNYNFYPIYTAINALEVSWHTRIQLYKKIFHEWNMKQKEEFIEKLFALSIPQSHQHIVILAKEFGLEENISKYVKTKVTEEDYKFALCNEEYMLSVYHSMSESSSIFSIYLQIACNLDHNLPVNHEIGSNKTAHRNIHSAFCMSENHNVSLVMRAIKQNALVFIQSIPSECIEDKHLNKCDNDEIYAILLNQKSATNIKCIRDVLNGGKIVKNDIVHIKRYVNCVKNQLLKGNVNHTAFKIFFPHFKIGDITLDIGMDNTTDKGLSLSKIKSLLVGEYIDGPISLKDVLKYYENLNKYLYGICRIDRLIFKNECLTDTTKTFSQLIYEFIQSKTALPNFTAINLIDRILDAHLDNKSATKTFEYDFIQTILNILKIVSSARNTLHDIHMSNELKKFFADYFLMGEKYYQLGYFQLELEDRYCQLTELKNICDKSKNSVSLNDRDLLNKSFRTNSQFVTYMNQTFGNFVTNMQSYFS